MYHRGISQPSQSRALEFLPPQLSSSSTELIRSYADILNSKNLNEKSRDCAENRQYFICNPVFAEIKQRSYVAVPS